MGEITFLHPAFFWLFLLLPFAVGWYRWKNKKEHATLKVSSLEGFRAAPSLLAKLRPLLFVLRMLVLCSLIIALARPRSLNTNSRATTTRGIDIVIAMDVSGSMLAKDLKPNRMESIKKVAAEFVDERPNDRIGLVVYAAEGYTKVPVTSDHAVVKEALKSVKFEFILKDGSDMGIGIATAINRLKDSKTKSKVIILLSDGVNNSGYMTPAMASDIAKEYGIRIYTIGVGKNGITELPTGDVVNGELTFGRYMVNIDETLLKEIAKKTDGRYFRASDNSSLKNIYNEINKLETSDIEDIRFYNYDEKFRLFVWGALGLLLIEIILRRTLYRSFI